MQHFISSIADSLQNALRHGGYWVIAVTAIVEGLPLVGSIIPGQTIVILGGFFAKLGLLNLYVVMILAAIGAVAGDVIAFVRGRRSGLDPITRWGKYFLIKESHIEKTRKVLDRHTGKALIFGRFNPFTRALMPYLAGASGIQIKKFWLYDTIGAVSWAILSVMIGYVFGASYTVVAQSIGQFMTMGIVIGLLLISAYTFINNRRHIFSKYDFHILVVCIGALYIFFKTVQDVMVAHPFLSELDVSINLVMAQNNTPELTRLMVLVSDIFSPLTLSIAAVGLGAWFIYKKYYHNLYVLVATLPAGLFLEYMLKLAVGRTRPINMIVNESGFSFPSGHAVAASIFFTLIIYFFSRYLKNIYSRELFLVANALIIILVCFSRVYLNVHWFSDVVAGSMFGLFWTTFVILTVHYVESLTTGRHAKKLK